MAELLGAAVRGLIVLIGHVLSALDVYELVAGRRRARRLAAVDRGERVEIPCVLKDSALTGATAQEGWLGLGGTEVTWRAKGGKGRVPFAPGRLTMQAVDQKAITFHSADGRGELRLHPDEAPAVLRALGDQPER